MPWAAELVAGVCYLGRGESRPQRGQLQLVALRRADSNNSISKSHRPDVRRRAFIPTTGPKSAMSRRTYPVNPQCGN